MEQCGLVISAILDADPQKAGTYFQKIPVVFLVVVDDQLCDSVVAITTEKYFVCYRCWRVYWRYGE